MLAYKNSTECNIDILYISEMFEYIKENWLDYSLVRNNISWSEQLKYGLDIDHLQYTSGNL